MPVATEEVSVVEITTEVMATIGEEEGEDEVVVAEVAVVTTTEIRTESQ